MTTTKETKDTKRTQGFIRRADQVLNPATDRDSEAKTAIEKTPAKEHRFSD